MSPKTFIIEIEESSFVKINFIDRKVDGRAISYTGIGYLIPNKFADEDVEHPDFSFQFTRMINDWNKISPVRISTEVYNVKEIANRLACALTNGVRNYERFSEDRFINLN